MVQCQFLPGITLGLFVISITFGLVGYFVHFRPNVVHEVDCDILSNNITTTYAARKSQCPPTCLGAFTPTCQNSILSNVSGTCNSEQSCCLQTRVGGRGILICDIYGVVPCTLVYCNKTTMEVDVTFYYSGLNERMMQFDCVGSFDVCDPENTTSTCIKRLDSLFFIGKRSCYYRERGNEFSLTEIPNNDEYDMGRTMIITCIALFGMGVVLLIVLVVLCFKYKQTLQ